MNKIIETNLLLLPHLLDQWNLIIIMIRIYIIMASTVQDVNSSKMPQVGKKTWHFASGTSCGAPAFNLYSVHLQCYIFHHLSSTCRTFWLIRVHFVCTRSQRPLQTDHRSVFVGGAAKKQPGFDFPTDLPVRGVVPMQHPALWHSDYVGTGPSWAPPTPFPRALGV